MHAVTLFLRELACIIALPLAVVLYVKASKAYHQRKAKRANDRAEQEAYEQMLRRVVRKMRT